MQYTIHTTNFFMLYTTPTTNLTICYTKFLQHISLYAIHNSYNKSQKLLYTSPKKLLPYAIENFQKIFHCMLYITPTTSITTCYTKFLQLNPLYAIHKSYNNSQNVVHKFPTINTNNFYTQAQQKLSLYIIHNSYNNSHHLLHNS